MDKVVTSCELVLWDPILGKMHRLKLSGGDWSLEIGPDEDSLSEVSLEGVPRYHEGTLTAILHDGRVLVIPSEPGLPLSRQPSMWHGDNISLLDVVSYEEGATHLPE